MLWGASMAIGAEAYRRKDDEGEAITLAINATKHIVESFLTKSVSTECEEITQTDFNSKLGLVKYMLTGKPIHCFNLAAKWAPKAIKAANEGLAIVLPQNAKESRSCASEVIKKMGGTDEETLMVAGFAGGIGLCGSGCGALGAAMWKITLELVKKGEWKYTVNNPTFDELIEKFYKVSDYEMECSKICGKKFSSVNEHSEYLNGGGCENIIVALGKS